MIPAPLNKRAWLAASECYRESGRDELAEMADFVVSTDSQSQHSCTVVRVAVVPLPADAEALKQVVEGLLKDS